MDSVSSCRSMRVAVALLVGVISTGTVAQQTDELVELRAQIEAQDLQIREQAATLARQTELLREMSERLRVIERAPNPQVAAEPSSTVAGSDGSNPQATTVHAVDPVVAAAPADTATKGSPSRTTVLERAERHVPGKGFSLMAGEAGSVGLRVYTSMRYINQNGFDDEYTDAFGVTRRIDLRNDIQHHKVNLTFYGWMFDPRLTWQLYTWTANANQGRSAQVVVSGNVNYAFSDWLRVGIGTDALPSTRSTSGNFPFWMSPDNRLIADEYFRGSYTGGVWARGAITDDLNYHVMLGNNLSQLGIDGAELDDEINTFAGTLAWQPLGDYGRDFGDFEWHDSLVTRLGVHYTRSTEDAQGQPDDDDTFENVQLRVSDGNSIFRPKLFAPDASIRKARYQMVAGEAGIKYRGLALEGELYSRWIDDLQVPGTGTLPFDELEDQGFQLIGSAMLVPRTLQAYLGGSYVDGEYGNPWDVRLGLNWYPFRNKGFRWNNELIYVDDSPVGGLTLPTQVGAEGTVFYSTLEVFF